MSTVLVPLDETAFAESIRPDATQLAGPGGHIVLVYVTADAERAGSCPGRTTRGELRAMEETGSFPVPNIVAWSARSAADPRERRLIVGRR